MRSILEGEGHQMYVAVNGEEALRLYLRHSIDVVVTDLQMPRGDGIELISALTGLDPDASIIAVSGKEPENLEVAQRSGAVSVLPKPLTKKALAEAVQNACGPPESDEAAG